MLHDVHNALYYFVRVIIKIMIYYFFMRSTFIAHKQFDYLIMFERDDNNLIKSQLFIEEIT